MKARPGEPANPRSTSSPPWWSEPEEALVARLGTSRAGLASAEAAARLAVAGAGRPREAPPSALRAVVRQLRNPLLLTMLVASVLSGALGEWSDAGIVVAMVALAVVLGSTQEWRAAVAVARLRDRLRTLATVMRDGAEQRVPVEDVVPGDVLVLSAGSVVAADSRLLAGKDLFVEQSALTGESMPSGKRPGAAEAVRALRDLRVGLKVLTGDHRLVAARAAAEVGLADPRVLTGAELDAATDQALLHLAPRTDVFAELDPHQKERIVRALRRSGAVVGFLGDGINDAPALHAADVGISVDSAVDVAREAADIILLRQDLGVLREGLEVGRRTFANSMKYVVTTTSANFGNMVSLALASLWLPFLPLLPQQILLNNFLSDVPSAALAGDRVDREWIDRPRRWTVGAIQRFMIAFGLLSSVFDLATFAILLALVGDHAPAFQTGWFLESLASELFVLLVVRTRRPVWQGRPGPWLLGSTLVVAAVAFVLPWLPGNAAFGLVPLPAEVMLAMAAVVLLYVAAAELLKRRLYAWLEAENAGTLPPASR